jgi:hypothetical protein
MLKLGFRRKIMQDKLALTVANSEKINAKKKFPVAGVGSTFLSESTCPG